jgi:Spy/CpxP family protein refolding chaperone
MNVRMHSALLAVLVWAGLVVGKAQPTPEPVPTPARPAPGAAPNVTPAAPGQTGLPNPLEGLTEEQRKAVRAVQEGARAEQRKIAEQLRNARRELEETLFADSLDEAAVRGKSAAVAAAEADLALVRARTFAKLKGIVPAEQARRIAGGRTDALPRAGAASRRPPGAPIPAPRGDAPATAPPAGK